MSEAEKGIVKDQIRAGVEALCCCAFFAVCVLLWIGTP